MKKPPYLLIHPRLLLQALLVEGSRHRWLIAHCLHGNCRPVSAPAFIQGIHRILHDPVFQLSEIDRMALYSEFLPRMEILSPHQLKMRVNIMLHPDFVIPHVSDEDDVAHLSPDFYKSLIGLDDDPVPAEEEP